LLSLASERDFWLQDYETVNTFIKYKAKYNKSSDGLLPIKTTCAKLLYFLVIKTSLRDVRKKKTKKKQREKIDRIVGGSNLISPFVCLSTLLRLASERHFGCKIMRL
jgi:hypothetical protein